jgi:fructosamine-3-kinase
MLTPDSPYATPERRSSLRGYPRTVDLAYLREHPQQLPTFLTHQRIRETPVGGGSICQTRRLTLSDGASVFAKSLNDPTDQTGAERISVPPHFFETEAAGLRWLAEARAAAVPEVIAVLPDLLVLEWVDQAEPAAAVAEGFGRDLAATHQAGADTFGAPWVGYIGSLPQDNAAGTSWPRWFAQRRLAPYLRLAADRGALGADDVDLVETVIGRIDQFGVGDEGPARLHGDLWPGNLLWAVDRVWLVDPAAHGGHRETDLAQLALFGGTAFLDRIIGGYLDVWPLADGWKARIPLHQLPLLLVHAALFGRSFRAAVLAAARSALRV